jgi:DNA-binding response OmpR family regulator
MPGRWDTIDRVDLRRTLDTPGDEDLEPFATWETDSIEPGWCYAESKILVVDDDNDTRRLIVSILEWEGLTALEAPDGEVAMTMAVSECPDLVILDVLMPGLDGYTVCRQLREDMCLHGVPVIMMTGLTGRDEELAGIACGADAYLVKPVSTLELLARVRELM